MTVSFDSIGQECVTVQSSSISAGTPCKFSANGFVSACSDGDAFHGVAIKHASGLTTLAVHGFVTLPYSGAAPTVGYCALAAALSGKVKTLDGAKEYLVVDVNSADSTVTFLL